MSTSEIAKLESRWRDNPQGLTFAPLAEAYRKQKDARRALEVLQPGLERHPDYIPANIVLGRCHWDLGDLESAEKAFSHVLTLDGENVIALKALADITERQSRPHEAERWLETLLSVDRSNEEARDQLARIRAVRSVSPPVETPLALDEYPAEEPPDVAGAPAASGPAFDPFPAIADQLPAAEPQDDASPPGWISAAGDAARPEPAEFPELTPPLPSPVVDQEPSAFAAPPLPDPDAFGFERAEEIVLNAGVGSEFQAPSASEDLVAGRIPASEPDLEQSRDDTGAMPQVPGAGEALAIEREPESSTASLSLDPPAPSALFGAYLPLEDAAVYEAPAIEAPSYEPPGAEPPIFEPPSADVAVAQDRDVELTSAAAVPAAEPAELDAPDGAEPDLVVTETMAQVFLRQGHVAEALAVYRELLARNPDSNRLGERVAELEERQRVLSAPPPRPSFVARDTGGQSLGGFFDALLAARLEGGASPTDGSPAEVELTPESAPATRPAEAPLSLGSVFGEDPPAVAPAVPPVAAAPDGAPGAVADPVSFDEFFAGAQAPVRTQAPVQPARPARVKPDDDLDQFHTWLQGLKR
jgi:tetratricopeptide (TPR) repeat protein